MGNSSADTINIFTIRSPAFKKSSWFQLWRKYSHQIQTVDTPFGKESVGNPSDAADFITTSLHSTFSCFHLWKHYNHKVLKAIASLWEEFIEHSSWDGGIVVTMWSIKVDKSSSPQLWRDHGHQIWIEQFI